jgi:hypothetical protein
VGLAAVYLPLPRFLKEALSASCLREVLATEPSLRIDSANRQLTGIPSSLICRRPPHQHLPSSAVHDSSSLFASLTVSLLISTQSLQDKMRFSTPLALTLFAGTLSNALPAPQDEATSTIVQASLPTEASTNPSVASDQVDELAQFAQQQANASLTDNASKRGTCNIFNVAVRREWGSLSQKERRDYTNAVLCLQSKKSKTPNSIVPGARSRFDDFVANHINQTLNIHYTGTFLGWHRYFTWQYEQALRNECGYKGYQPYWDWAKTAATGLENSPILDGSDYSMSGNGEFVAGPGEVVIANTGPPEIRLPRGSGGGCVKSGPFKVCLICSVAVPDANGLSRTWR